MMSQSGTHHKAVVLRWKCLRRLDLCDDGEGWLQIREAATLQVGDNSSVH